jgi:hypothetical protein
MQKVSREKRKKSQKSSPQVIVYIFKEKSGIGGKRYGNDAPAVSGDKGARRSVGREGQELRDEGSGKDLGGARLIFNAGFYDTAGGTGGEDALDSG